jgi:serine/tyrosine/threonine adenylyltransferase
MTFAFDNTFARLPATFFSPAKPTAVRAPRVVRVNRPLAELLGLDPDVLASPEGAAWLSGNTLPEGAEPIALAYAGHQFGHFSGQLGDGRAILLGEIVGRDGIRRDLQLKGSGRTPYSRGGDGRAALGPVLREYIVSEAMAALGVPTTRALAAVTTGEPISRERVLPGAIFVRVATSHLRVGTFELLAARRDVEGLKRMTTYALARHYPARLAETADAGGNEALALLDEVIGAQARLVARWLGLGFIHGVMNTDNTSISGETIDYGPCAFLDTFDPKKTFSSIDHGGRYAFANQPRIAHWNLARLAESLLELIADDEQEAVRLAMERLDTFDARFANERGAVMGKKIGLSIIRPEDDALVGDLLARMATNHVDFTLFFRRLWECAKDQSNDAKAGALFDTPMAFFDWAERWRARLATEPGTEAERAERLRTANPAFIPRNHRIEEAIQAAEREGDFQPFHTLVEVLQRPFDDQPAHAALRTPPKPEEEVRATFCGTLPVRGGACPVRREGEREVTVRACG